jgi:hypothetical protein
MSGQGKEVNIHRMATTATNDWSRFYFPEVLPALYSVGELSPDLKFKFKGETDSETPENQPGQEFRWATLRRAALDSPDFQKFLNDLIHSGPKGNDERYKRLLAYQIKGMCRFPSLTGFNWDMYKVRTTLCLLCLEAAGYITKKEYIK